MQNKVKFNLGAVIDESGNIVNSKTGGWRILRPIWHKEKCTQCMQCWQHCPDMAIPQEKGKRTETNLDFCKGCGICTQVCPVKCIEMIKEEK